MRTLCCVALLIVLSGLGGCGLVQGPAVVSTATPTASASSAVRATGMVHGGQNPVSGSVIQLYAVGTSGYGQGATPLIGATVTTSDGTGTLDSNANAGNANNTLPVGSFTISGDYTCPSFTTPVYLTATGGNPGLTSGTNNSALTLVAALGQCGLLNPSSYIIINEVTTVGAVFALAPFIGAGGVGSDSGGTGAIANASNSVRNLVNNSTGTALSTSSGGQTVPQARIDTLANILVPCVNSTGPTSTACTSLFSAVTPSGGTAPTTVLGAILDIALNPANNVTSIYNLSTANAAFQPAATTAPLLWNVIPSGSGESACGYSNGGWTVTGTVAYSGTKTGQIYLSMNNTAGCAIGAQGVSISSKGAFTIHGVPSGSPNATYTLNAFMDTLGKGATNAGDPVGSTTVTVGNADVTGVSVTLADPSPVTIGVAPTIQQVLPFNNGAAVFFSQVINSSNVEMATSYTLQWSTTSNFASIAGSKTFPAVGTSAGNFLLVSSGLTNGSSYYFRAYASSAGTAAGPYSTAFGPVTVGQSTTGNSVSGAITFGGTATGPMYIGLYNPYANPPTGTPYGESIAAPVSSQAYTLYAPTNTAPVYESVAIIDQNNDGVVDPGDITNVNSYGKPLFPLTGTTANENITLPSGNSIATVYTQSLMSGGTESYGLGFQVIWGAKLPVAVTLEPSYNPDGANVPGPIDIALCGQGNSNCTQGFQLGFNLGSTVPTVGDTYIFDITYSDGTTGTVVATVTGVLNNFATNLAPTTGTSTSTTPTFTWSAPVCAACSSYTYQFYINPTNGGNQIWYVPGGAPNGLLYTTTSLVWGVDPTNSANTPSVSSLTTNTTYTWSIGVLDSYGNTAVQQVSYEP
jgi:hypothetical protein